MVFFLFLYQVHPAAAYLIWQKWGEKGRVGAKLDDTTKGLFKNTATPLQMYNRNIT
jgi:hypothetical protein